MPCYRCGARQTDPGRGQSPWRRGVRHDCQVLVCPECQVAHDWAGDLDRCPRCQSVHLVRRLGEVECRDCGAVVPPPGAAGGFSAPGGFSAADEFSAPAGGVPVAGEQSYGGQAHGGQAHGGQAQGGQAHGGQAPGLSEEVARALERVLGRSAARR